MDSDKICRKLEEAVSSRNAEGFLTGFMEAYGFSRTSIVRTLNGTAAITVEGVYDRKKDFLLKVLPQTPYLERNFQEAIGEAHNKERFVIVTDFAHFFAKDMNTKEGISVECAKLPDHYEFFLPLMGIEKLDVVTENAADVKAAQKMSALFDEIQINNPCETDAERHAMNVFLNRLLFCYFADDTNIFSENQFINSVNQNTATDGFDLATYLEGLFEVLNTPIEKRYCKTCYKHFPYVNGGLFKDYYPVPQFTAKSRQHLIECGEFNWSAINPDIFGSMFQTVIDPQHRSELGQHYTSVSNIMKVLNPLFLDDLRAELDEIIAMADDNSSPALRTKKDKKLDEYRIKLAKIKVFDPACGSGNFLITAYKEICRLEIRAIKEYFQKVFSMLSIEINHFYGIEIDDFPAEVAKLSLWLAQHQMNMECAEVGIQTKPTLPLQEAGHIVHGNALSIPWEEVCPCKEGDILYIAGNPPFNGGMSLEPEQRGERNTILGSIKNIGRMDYVTCWYVLAARYINVHSTVSVAFVSTNSVFQGVQSGFWQLVFAEDVGIRFAYESFKWKNNAGKSAGVTVTIVGIEKNKRITHRYIYSEAKRKEVPFIGANMNGFDVCVETRSLPFDKSVPVADNGTKFTDDGQLILSKDEKDLLIQKYPYLKKNIRLCIGSLELIRGESRWCLWINDSEVETLSIIPEIRSRLEHVKNFRENSTSMSTQRSACTYWKPFYCPFEKAEKASSVLIIPRVSSETREYIPIGFFSAGTVVIDSAFAIYDAPKWLFAILESKMHMAWMRTVCGRLKTDYRYSTKLCYNTFPFPALNDEKKKILIEKAQAISNAREENYGITLAQRYDPEKMPSMLRTAHEENDQYVDSLYNPNGFENDEARLNELFKRYTKLVEKEKK